MTRPAPFGAASLYISVVVSAQNFSAGLSDDSGNVLVRVDALTLTTNVTHSPGGYPGDKINLPLNGTELSDRLDLLASLLDLLETAWVVE